MLQDFFQGIQELVFPDNCFLCQSYLNSSHHKQLCTSCLEGVTLNTPPFCLGCSRHLTIFNAQGLCPTCLKQVYAFDVAYAACLYTEPLSELIHAFKYHGKTSLRKSFNTLMLHYLDTYHIPVENFDIILPMPLHPTRFRERSFNQAELLSQPIAVHYQVAHRTDLVSRIKHTPSQTTAEAKQRWTNVREAFRINNSLDIADKSVLIVDDLLTTAATADALAATLKNAGAAYVGVLTLAITP